MIASSASNITPNISSIPLPSPYFLDQMMRTLMNPSVIAMGSATAYITRREIEPIMLFSLARRLRKPSSRT
jgi:hypothetical protein